MLKFRRLVTCLFCIGLVAAFLCCAATKTRESTGQYVDDSMITAKVKAAILDEPRLKSLQIEVTTYQGVVQLSGFVDSVQSAQLAGSVAGTVGGVTRVTNDLVVK